MAGLVPAIHVLLAIETKKDVDARNKCGHDGSKCRSCDAVATCGGVCIWARLLRLKRQQLQNL
jgi:radical SAM protein with 4Fe4S-binding SPASM domain